MLSSSASTGLTFDVVEVEVHSKKRKVAAAVSEFLAINGSGFIFYLLLDVITPPGFKSFFNSALTFGQAFLNTQTTTIPWRFLNYVRNPSNPLANLEALKTLGETYALDITTAGLVGGAYLLINHFTGRSPEEMSLGERATVLSTANAIVRKGLEYVPVTACLEKVGLFKPKTAESDALLKKKGNKKHKEKETELQTSNHRNPFGSSTL
jgi:hypothetical protein